MSDRGEYRAIRRVLLNGKDFRRLPERARFAFLCLKLNIGPSGIEDWEPEALVVTLAAQMGASADQVRISLDMLEHAGWIRREDNVVWVVGQLEHDPHIKVGDAKHRKSIQRHVSGLPNLPIRGAFVDLHRPWFEDQDSPLKPLARANPKVRKGSSKGLRRAFEAPITEDKTENEQDFTGASAPVNWVAIATDIIAAVGTFPHGRVGKALRAVVDRYGWPETERGLRDYVAAPKNGRHRTPEYFAQESGTWVVGAREGMADEHGVPTDRANRLVGTHV